ncbi:hypothetical protein [Klebsiella variicola]|uniref:hypothetical protein n=1 Tax=Klebsiella variicola TaxID=244366 RepID=UPI003D03457E
MYSKQDLKNAQAFVELFINTLHDRMLVCNEDELIKLRYQIDGMKKFDNKLSLEIKANESEWLKALSD